MKKTAFWLAILLILPAILLSACGPHGYNTKVVDRPVGWGQKGKACWYGEQYHGKATASGEIFDMYKLTAAHKSLPFNTLVRVKNLNNGKTVLVRINDRGPFVAGRIIDLSYAAAKKVDMINDGVVPCTLEVVKKGK